MDGRNDALPEGTDSIIDTDKVAEDVKEGARAAKRATAENIEVLSSKGRAAAKKVGEAAAGLRDQAAGRAKELASQGKDKAASALEGVTKLVGEAAGKIDDNVGEQYGAYARRAAEAVSGFASTLRSSEVEELLHKARETVRKNPAIAIGAAAAMGFALARLVRAGSASAEEPKQTPPRTGKAPRIRTPKATAKKSD